MEADIAGPSHSYDVEFDEDFIRNAGHMSIDKLLEELDLLKRDTHPLLLTERRKIGKQRQVQDTRILRHRARAEDRAKHEYVTREREYTAQFEVRVRELEEEANGRVDEMEKYNIQEYGVIDITKAGGTQQSFDTNKKTLRGRGGGNLIEPATYFNSHPPTKIPEFNITLAFENARIRGDLFAIRNRLPSPVPGVKKRNLNVTIIKPKLIFENRTFKHGEDVIVWCKTFNEIHAKLDIVNEKVIGLKGINGWDSRQLTATTEDLEEGRVIITKLKGKDKLL
ncbi:hypothetical protein L5515_004200 [Caenorhabditis briggsae]|uniref:Uncharacterized protein n=1 Tax=Caenorhabditis briggsae TaxID=6238 RepID=A0AAE9EGX5_CAEBR|nr:hypothetical protein L3Y34_001342 [Caenorhabditis briggsae]UMM23523.1 hypothetical protein L5515_004200 [Caenorhabditis briggsae]